MSFFLFLYLCLCPSYSHTFPCLFIPTSVAALIHLISSIFLLSFTNESISFKKKSFSLYNNFENSVIYPCIWKLKIITNWLSCNNFFFHFPCTCNLLVTSVQNLGEKQIVYILCAYTPIKTAVIPNAIKVNRHAYFVMFFLRPALGVTARACHCPGRS